MKMNQAGIYNSGVCPPAIFPPTGTSSRGLEGVPLNSGPNSFVPGLGVDMNCPVGQLVSGTDSMAPQQPAMFSNPPSAATGNFPQLREMIGLMDTGTGAQQIFGAQPMSYIDPFSGLSGSSPVPRPVLSAAEVELFGQLWGEAIAAGGSAACGQFGGDDETLDASVAGAYLTRSGLPQETLHEIWRIGVPAAQTQIDAPTFAVLCRFVACAQRGLPLNAYMTPDPENPILPSFSNKITSVWPSSEQKILSTATNDLPLFSGVGGGLAPGVPSSDELQSYARLFNAKTLEYNGLGGSMGHLNGEQLRPLLAASGLPDAELAAIWTLVDTDSDGNLSLAEFAAAMALAARRRVGCPLPLVLPSELCPASLMPLLQSASVATHPKLTENAAPAVLALSSAWESISAPTDGGDPNLIHSQDADEDAQRIHSSPKLSSKRNKTTSPRSRKKKGSDARQRSGSRGGSSNDDDLIKGRKTEKSSDSTSEQIPVKECAPTEFQTLDNNVSPSFDSLEDFALIGDDPSTGGASIYERKINTANSFGLKDADESKPGRSPELIGVAFNGLEKTEDYSLEPQFRGSVTARKNGSSESAVALIEGTIESDRRLSMLLATDVDAAAEELLQLRSLAEALRVDLVTAKKKLALQIDRKREFESLIAHERRTLHQLKEKRREVELEGVGVRRDLSHYQEEILFLQQQVAEAEEDLVQLTQQNKAGEAQRTAKEELLGQRDANRKRCMDELAQEKLLVQQEEREIEELKGVLKRMRRERSGALAKQSAIQEQLRQADHDVLLQFTATDKAREETVELKNKRIELLDQKRAIINDMNSITQQSWIEQRMLMSQSDYASRQTGQAALQGVRMNHPNTSTSKLRDAKGVPTGSGSTLQVQPSSVGNRLVNEAQSVPSDWLRFDAEEQSIQRSFVAPMNIAAPRPFTVGSKDVNFCNPSSSMQKTDSDNEKIRPPLDHLVLDSVKSDVQLSDVGIGNRRRDARLTAVNSDGHSFVKCNSACRRGSLASECSVGAYRNSHVSNLAHKQAKRRTSEDSQDMYAGHQTPSFGGRQ